MILRADLKEEGIRFFTPDTFFQQLGYMNRPRGYVIPPHNHNAVPRTIEWTQEVLSVMKDAQIPMPPRSSRPAGQ